MIRGSSEAINRLHVWLMLCDYLLTIAKLIGQEILASLNLWGRFFVLWKFICLGGESLLRTGNSATHLRSHMAAIIDQGKFGLYSLETWFTMETRFSTSHRVRINFEGRHLRFTGISRDANRCGHIMVPFRTGNLVCSWGSLSYPWNVSLQHLISPLSKENRASPVSEKSRMFSHFEQIKIRNSVFVLLVIK